MKHSGVVFRAEIQTCLCAFSQCLEGGDGVHCLTEGIGGERDAARGSANVGDGLHSGSLSDGDVGRTDNDITVGGSWIAAVCSVTNGRSCGSRGYRHCHAWGLCGLWPERA